jgi:hypothetical protein
MAQAPSTTRIRLNDQTYEFGLMLFNSKDTFFGINTAALVKLSIQEDSRDWFKRGYVIINNNENIIERRPNERISAAANYKFRNDGRDLLLVNIKPVYDNPSKSLEMDAFPSQGWELKYIFSIYDVEDIPGKLPNEKNIKLYFWELDYQLFAESTSVGWNSNVALYNLNPSLNGKSSVLSDNDRKIPTGLILKSLIENTLNARSGIQTFSQFWDPGASRMFYNPPTNNSAIDDLDYVFNRHVASKKFGSVDGDLPLLYRDRYTKEWTLTSLSTELSLAVASKAAGPWQLEQLFLTSSTPTGVTIPSLLKTPQSRASYLNLNLGGTSTVTNYQFVDMAAIDNAFMFINMPCASNNIRNKQFSVDYADNTVDSIKSYFQNNYVQKFSNYDAPTALLSLNKTKTENISYKETYSYGATKLERYPESRNTILKTGFFLNQCLHFTAPGTTLRRCNRFIGLDRQIGAVDADFDEKFLGQWYIIKVEHVFTANSYTNNVTAVKPHADKNTRIPDDVL